ncbi:hypothetical protein I4U23_023447 [Adineta vaga]|nr:hypothetical protein I4U23_023447 [Adineta vaga]
MAVQHSNDSSNTVVENNSTLLDTPAKSSFSSMAQFWIILCFEIPSIICTLFLLFCLFYHRTLRQSLSNHITIILLVTVLFIEIIDYPHQLVYLQWNYSLYRTPALCYLWWIVSWGFYNLISILMVWLSIERHILIFHHQWLTTQKQRLIIHYIPMFIIPFISPTLLVVVINVIFFVRVVKQKQHLHQQVQWHKYRRMIIQLSACAGLFLVGNLPATTLIIVQRAGLPYSLTSQFEDYIWFFNYFLVLWLPFVCLRSSKEIWTRAREMLTKQRFLNRIVPQSTKP